jgi:hypothetical protein
MLQHYHSIFDFSRSLPYVMLCLLYICTRFLSLKLRVSSGRVKIFCAVLYRAVAVRVVGECEIFSFQPVNDSIRDLFEEFIRSV